MARGRGRSLLALPMRGGVDELNDERHVQPGKALVLENARWETMGRYEKRAGHTVKATTINGSALDTATTKRGRLAAYENEVIAIDGVKLGSYVPELTTDLRDRGFVSEASLTATGQVFDPFSVSSCDCIQTANYVIWCWVPQYGPNSSYVYYTVFSASTGACVHPPTRLSAAYAGTLVRLCNVGNDVYAVYPTGANTITGRKWNGSSAIWSAAVNLCTDANASNQFDVAGSSTHVYLAYCENGANNARVRRLDTALGFQADNNYIDAYAAAKTGWGIHATVGESIWVTYLVTNAGTTYATLWGINEATFVSGTGPIRVETTTTDTFVHTAVTRYDADECVWTLNALHAAPTYAPYTECGRVDTSASVIVAGNKRITHQTYHASKPFVRGGRAYAFGYVGGRSTSNVGSQVESWSAVLVDLRLDDTAAYANGAPARPVGLDLPRYAAQPGFGRHSMPTGTADTWFTAIHAYTGGSIAGGDRCVGVYRVTADFAANTLWQPAALGRTLQLSGGIITEYDGIGTGELGFLHEPVEFSVADSATAGSLVAATQYKWCAIYTYVDARGQLHRSPPSEIITHTTGAGKTSVDIRVSNYGLSLRQNMADSFERIISIEIYRTKATSSDPNTFYRTTAISLNTASYPYTEYQTINDGTSDSTLDGTTAAGVPTPRPTIYTTGGAGEVIVNEVARSYHGLVAARGRLWAIYENRVHFSKPIVDGVAPEMFPDSRAIVIEDAKALTAIAPLDDKIVVFSETGIWVSMAEGPDALYRGVLPTFRQVSSDYGCIDARSIGATPTGITFQSRAGLYMLTRALEVAFIGGDIQATLDTYPTVTSTVVHPSGQYMLFGVTDGTSGRRIIRDTRAQLFGVDALASSGGAVFPVSQVVVGPDYYYLGSDGKLYREDTSTYLDDSAWVTLRVKLPHIQAAGLGGSQDTQRLVVRTEKFTDYDLNLKIYSDFETSASQTKLFGHATIAAYTVADQHEIDIVRQDCQSMAVELYDATPTGGGTIGTGRGAAFIGVTLELQPVDGPVRLPGANRG